MKRLWRRARLDVALPWGGAVLVLAVGAFALLGSESASERDGLVGQTLYDFGIVGLAEAPPELTHNFVLTNHSSRARELRSMKSTCGCTRAVTDVEHVPPGSDIHISATLSLLAPGVKEAQIVLTFDSGEVIPLTIRATGRRARQLWAVEQQVQIRHGEPAPIHLFALDSEGDEVPNDPEITLTSGLSARFDGWRLVHSLHKPTGHPARWEGSVVVIVDSEDSFHGAGRVSIRCCDSPAVAIPISSTRIDRRH